MRVLHIASGDRWAGAEVQLFTLLSQLVRRADIETHAVLLNDGELASRLRKAGVSVHILDESQLGNLAIFRALCTLLQRLHPEVVHTHRIKENIFGAIANQLTCRAACLRTVHGADEHPPTGWRGIPQQLLRKLDQWVGQYLQQRIVAVSTPLAKQLASIFSIDRIHIVENGVDIEAIRNAIHTVDFRAARPTAIHVGLIGRLDPVKRIDIFLKMAQLLIQDTPERLWSFHILGEGNLQQELQELSIKLGLKEAVSFHGHRSDIPSCLAGLDLLVICSDHEGLPMTLLESLAIGTPVIAHAVGGMASVLTRELEILQVKDHTPQGYANTVNTILDRDLSTISLAGRQRVEDAYSAADNASSIWHLYCQLTDVKRPS